MTDLRMNNYFANSYWSVVMQFSYSDMLNTVTKLVARFKLGFRIKSGLGVWAGSHSYGQG